MDIHGRMMHWHIQEYRIYSPAMKDTKRTPEVIEDVEEQINRYKTSCVLQYWDFVGWIYAYVHRKLYLFRIHPHYYLKT